jgi:FAD-linked sulfhydryl oxidase
MKEVVLLGGLLVGGVAALVIAANKTNAPASPSTFGAVPTLAEAGRRTWNKWHALARTYSPANAAAFRQMILDDIAALPCQDCVNHATAYVLANPIPLETQAGVRAWLCDLHNKVNARLGKPIFDCALA